MPALFHIESLYSPRARPPTLRFRSPHLRTRFARPLADLVQIRLCPAGL